MLDSLIKLASISATVWLIGLAAMWTADIAIRRRPVEQRKYYRRIYAKNGVTGYTAWLHSDPSIRQTAYNAKWDAEDACKAADLWASEFFIATPTRIDFEPEAK